VKKNASKWLLGGMVGTKKQKRTKKSKCISRLSDQDLFLPEEVL
jgi:hypothetical protein